MHNLFYTFAVGIDQVFVVPGVNEYNNQYMGNLNLSPARKTIVGIQFLFVAFGSTVLVPLLVGLDPATALFTAGLGTFIFHFKGGKTKCEKTEDNGKGLFTLYIKEL